MGDGCRGIDVVWSSSLISDGTWTICAIVLSTNGGEAQGLRRTVLESELPSDG